MEISKIGKPNYSKIIPLLIIILSPVAFLGTVFYNSGKFYSQIAAFQYQTPPDPSSFLDTNYTRYTEMAEYYDYRYEEFHIPLNMSTDTKFADDDCTIVQRYQFSDNTGQWTGLAITGYVFKYLTAIKENNETLKADALRVVRKLLNGMSMQLAVPNGGLGSEFGGILARGWAGPQHFNHLDIYPGTDWYSDENPQHHNGTGIYEDYRWRGFTSNDEYSGFYSGMAFVLKYIQEQDVQDLVSLMIEQTASYMLETNFLGIDWHGGATGVHQKSFFLLGGSWTLLLLKMASLVNPGKYERYYSHFVSEEFYGAGSVEGGEQETIANYYAYAFGYHIVFALIMLEEYQPLHNLYLDNFRKSLEHFTQYHRNPFYNIIRLIVNGTAPDENVLLERDIEDSLTRYDTPYHFPDRAFGHAEIPNHYEEIEIFNELGDFINNSGLLAPIYELIFSEINRDEVYYSKPLTPEYMDSNIFIWEKNPFKTKNSYVNIRYEYAGYQFSLVYWMARAFEFFPSGGMR